MFLEWLLIAILVACAALLVCAHWKSARIRLVVLLVSITAMLAAGAWAKSLNQRASAREQVTVPHLGRPQQYASSTACQACHPSQYDSWHRSFHRTMTQLASPESIRGKFDDVTLELDGEIFHLQRRGEEFWIEMDDPEAKLQAAAASSVASGAKAVETASHPSVSRPNPSGGARVQRRVSMVTGSHYMQAYWVDNQHGNQQFSFPFTYLFEQQRWVPRRSVFLKDPKVLPFTQVWNVGCIECHATAGQSRLTDGVSAFDSRVAELGISCEACHGPAGEHVRLHSDPRRRYLAHLKPPPIPSDARGAWAKVSADGPAQLQAPSIVNPAKLNARPAIPSTSSAQSPHDSSPNTDQSAPITSPATPLAVINPAKLSSKRSSEVCGACHSVHGARDQNEWLREGIVFRPGDDLESKMNVHRRPKSPEMRVGCFWNDGMIRISGREFNGLINTACYLKGEMSCLSCHSMHDSSPTNQVAAAMESNTACLQCHTKMAKNLEQHTHHAADSNGSLCYNCHMPYTTYGLLKALRSHQISNPDVKTSLQTGRPNACNLCHLDKNLDWTARNLSSWYRIEPPSAALLSSVYPNSPATNVAASILWALQGDAGQRALIAWHMGWKPALDASKSTHNTWIAPVLAPLLDDPYAAVRYIAGRSLKRLPGFEDFNYDYIAGADQLHRARELAIETASKTTQPLQSASLLLKENGQHDQNAASVLLKARNNRSLELLE